MIKSFFVSLLLIVSMFPAIALSFSFPEIGFCPLGGPPGWFNRMTGQHDRYYYPPPPMYQFQYRPVAPPVWQTPVRRQPPVYYPQYPVTN